MRGGAARSYGSARPHHKRRSDNMSSVPSRTWLAPVAVAVTVAVLSAACATGAPAGNKADGAADPVVLRMANTYGDLG